MGKTVLELKNLKKSFGSYTVLDGLSLTLEAGELYGFIGANGAGKTTTLKIAAGLLAPDEGEVTICGEDLWANRGDMKVSRFILSRIGYVPDSFGLYDNMRVSEYMDFFAACYSMNGIRARRRCEMLLGMTGLSEKAGYYVNSLSRGMKQRLCLARALIHNPTLLILDEPASGLDPVTRTHYLSILRTLREQGKTLIISSHILSELSDICTAAGILENGKMLVSGTLEQIFAGVSLSRPILISVMGDKTTALRILKEERLVTSISVSGDEMRIDFKGSREDETRLLRTMIENGVRVSGFMRERGDLETVFLQLAGKQEERAVMEYEMESGISEGDYR
ncbi:MAG: ABC transporter ATP-binding protein [Clostridium sp.]|nr:ABC transporter ATP-binding protein [Clostridium sp.]MBO6150125.1 ABC transporter ATP-binding protein [Clostridium sp.]